MADTGFLRKEKVEEFLKELVKKSVVYVPCTEGDTVLFQPYEAGKNICLDRPANSSPKLAIFPQSDTLFTFEYSKNPDDPRKMSVELKETTEYSDAVIFGSRPCDAKGFMIYDRAYLDTNTPDPYYKGRREKTTIVTLCCNSPFTGCFCTAVGGGPADQDGSDVMMSDLEKGFFLEAVTDKGKKILSLPQIEDGSSYAKEAGDIQLKAVEKVRNPFGAERPVISRELFDLDEFWEENLTKCLSCGACTYLCPTCYCFNITDEQVFTGGERLRSWDGCMFPHFTLEASGHNPRPTKYKRYKNRVGHKFVYYPEKYEGVIACSGCGRCIRYCPVSVDISEIVSKLKGPLAHIPKEDANAKNNSREQK